MPQPPVGRRNKEEFQNIWEYWNIYMNLLNRELYKYEWELPETCDWRFFELSLIHYGTALFAYDKDKKEFYTLHANPTDVQTMYGYYKKASGWAWNYRKDFKVYIPGTPMSVAKETVNGVLGYNNDLHYPSFFYLEQQAARLCNTTRAIDVAVENMKTPYIIACDKNNVDTIKDAITDKKNNHEAIIISDNLLANGDLPIEVYPIATQPEVLTKFWENYYNVEEYTKQLQGFDSNPSADKRERLLTSEVESNDSVTFVNDDLGLKTRQELCDLVNEIFADKLDKPISVKSRLQDIQKEDENDLLASMVPPTSTDRGISGDSSNDI